MLNDGDDSALKVLIYEPFPAGHRFEYLRHILPALDQLGVDIVVASTALGLQSEEFQIHLSPLSNLFEQYQCGVVSDETPRKSAATSLRQFLLTLKSTRPDHAYFPLADGVTQTAGLRSCFRRLYREDIQTEALHFRGRYGYRSIGNLRERIRDKTYRFFTYRSPWTKYWHVDPWQLDSLCQNAPQFRQRTVLMPDPVTPTAHIDRIEARRELGISDRGTIIGCAGPMAGRKGIHLLIDAFAGAVSKLPADTRLLLFGKFTPEMQHHLSLQDLATKSRMIIRDQRLTNREMEIVIPAMDVVCTPYPRSAGSSGIVLRAIAAERPLVAANAYWMGKIVPPLRAGVTCDVRDVPALSKTLVEAVRDCRSFRQSDAAKKYLEFQSIANFRATWTSLLRQRLGLPEHPDRIYWEEVASIFPKSFATASRQLAD